MFYLTQLLHRHLQQDGAKLALVCGGDRRSYGELHANVSRLGTCLRRMGVSQGDRVALLSQASIDCVELMFACWWIGAVFCPLNIRWSAAEIADSFSDCTPSVAFVDEGYGDLFDQVRERSRSVPRSVCIQRGAAAPDDSYPALLQTTPASEDERLGGGSIATLIYTGGTTGRAKGVQLTHDVLGAAVAGRLAGLPAFDESVALIGTPLFHVAALARILPHLTAGGACVLMRQFRPGDALALIEAEGVTDVPFVPTMLQMLLDHPEFRPQRLHSVRRLSYGAAPSADTLLQRAMRTLPWVGFYQYYGMTESCASGTLSLPCDHQPQGWTDGRATSAGRAISMVEVRIVDQHDEPVPPGTVGEILLRGPIVAPGYWNRPEETAHTLRGGWLHTGDAGRLDANGYLHVVDRIKDMIVTGGENVYGAEVENALLQHPAISMAAVIGVPSDRWGEAVHAVIVLRTGEGADQVSLQAHCRQLVAPYKVPKSVEFVDALPLTPAGKVAKNILRQKFWEGRVRRVN